MVCALCLIPMVLRGGLKPETVALHGHSHLFCFNCMHIYKRSYMSFYVLMNSLDD